MLADFIYNDFTSIIFAKSRFRQSSKRIVIYLCHRLSSLFMYPFVSERCFVDILMLDYSFVKVSSRYFNIIIRMEYFLD